MPSALTPTRLVFALLAALALGPCVHLGAAEDPVPKPATDSLPTLYVCGDSTAARDSLPIEGWGEEVGAFFDPTRVHVENRARGGRSARTFIEEGLWQAVISQLRPGDVVLLQFGHNDSKSAMSLSRYDLSGTGDEIENRTDAKTGKKIVIHTYGFYLRQMIEQARAKGAAVFVLSPVPRCKWENGKIVRGEEQHGLWAAEVAHATGVPFVDVNTTLADIYDRVGRTRTKALYFPQDNTHTNPTGAKLNAACVVTDLAQLDHPQLRALLKSDARATAAALIAAVPQAAAQLRVALPVGSAFPAPKAANVCPDTPLRLTFATPPTLGQAGKIHLVDAATGQDVDVIDLRSPTATKSIGGEPNFVYYPVIVSGLEATIYPRNGALQYGKTYYVTADAGVFHDATEAYAALTRDDGWTFTTKPAAPVRGSTRLTVAADGTGDFCTVQGAIDFVPDGNTTPTTITIRRGTYTEIVFFTNKHALTLVGESRQQSVIEYATNDRFNRTSGNPFGNNTPNPSAAHVGGHIYHRGVFLAHRANDLTLANLTIRNTTPQGGSQAEAIILNGTTTARAILKDVDLYSYQDTLQINGQAYLSGCYIEGDVDFMWGTGPCFFENCTCRALRSGAYYTQIRNPGTNHGYVYAHCTFDGAQGIMGNYLSRIGTGRFPHSEVVLLDCQLTTAVGPIAWQFQGGREGDERDPAEVHFWEFNSHDPAGQPVDMTFRLPGSKRLNDTTDAVTIAHYRDPAFVLGNDWNPRAAPIFHPAAKPASAAGAPTIFLQPAAQLALLGTSPSFSVGATGGSDRISYQWRKDGQPIPGATSATLRIEPMTWADAAVYTVDAHNLAGTTTSEPARLTAVAPQAVPAPDLPRIPSRTFDVTTFGAVADGRTDNTAALQKTIDATLAAGGGIVTIPAGAKPYLCGPLTLGSNLNLEIAAGAVLRLLPYSAEAAPGGYPRHGNEYPNFITATKAHDVAITGAGVIDGDGEAWWQAFRADHGMPHRPFLVRLTKCERVLVSGITLMRSPMFHVAINADHLTVFGITIHTPDGTPNTDGVDPSGQHQLFQNCAISCGDDNLVMKAGAAFCTDITVADCAFGEGHGMSVGGQSNRGLDGMTVKNCSFDGTTSALRLKADPTQGGDVKNITYTNLTMQHVLYPIVFYSYYNKVGNPGAVSGGNLTTPEKVKTWNTTPPNSLASATLSTWRSITLSNVLATDTKGYSIIWGLPTAAGFISDIKLHNVQITGGPGLEVYDAANIQLTGNSDLGKVTTYNATALIGQPRSATVASGANATFTVRAITPEGATFAWTFEGKPIQDGPRSDGTTVTGAATPTLTLSKVQAAEAGKYAVTISAALDAYDAAAKKLVPGSAPVHLTSESALLTIAQ